MPQNADSIPLDDEDILDLTVVAEPGKQTGETAPAANGGPGSPQDAPGGDFSADLDALLDSLAPNEAMAGPAASSEPGPPASVAPAAPVAAPIEDQTPVSHVVDPNEEIAMPETADIDSLLAELGAEAPAPELVPEEPALEEPAPEPVPESAPEAPAAPAVSAPMTEFDGILAQAQAADAMKAAEEASAASAPDPEPPAEQAADAAAVLPAPEGGPDDGLDLNELDALLDDILATAPEMSSPQSAAEPVAAQDDSAVIPVPEQALAPSAESDPAVLARLRQLEEAVEILETENSSRISEAMIEALVGSKIAAFLEPGSPAMEKIAAEVLKAFTALEGGGEAGDAFRAGLEKMAAAAAAKVIREEIAGLMSEG